MGVIAMSRYETRPGRFADQVAAGVAAVGHFRRLDIAAFHLQCIAGTDIGSTTMVLNFADAKGYAAGVATVQADEEWQSYWAGLMGDPPATQVESTLLVDLDPGFQPDPTRPLGCLFGTQWRPKDGRIGDFAERVMEAAPHAQRMGATVRATQTVVGQYPLTFLIAYGFADLGGYGAFADTSGTDEEWQAFWSDAMADPTADLVRSGVYVNISDG